MFTSYPPSSPPCSPDASNCTCTAKAQAEALDAHDAVAQAIWQSSPNNARQAMHRIVDEVAETLQLS